MPFSTFDELQAAIASWAIRSDLTSQIPDFIVLAEARINAEPNFRVRQMIAQATGSFTTGESTLAQPSDFLGVSLFQVASNPVVVLELRPAGQAVATDTGTVGGPKVYAIVGTDFEILPPPDSSYTYTLDYYATLTPLSDDDPTNWLLAKAPNLYLYASLMDLWIFLQDDEQLVRYTAAYESLRDKLIAADKRAGISSSPLVARVA